MSEQLTRRDALKLTATGTIATALSSTNLGAADSPSQVADTWSQSHDRVWLGPEFWANPMEDWQLKDGAAECRTVGPQRSVHSLTHELSDPASGFSMSVVVERCAAGEADGGAGFRIGCRSEINEYRSNCFARNGINAGLRSGQLFLGEQSVMLEGCVAPDALELHLSGARHADGVALTLEARSLADSQPLNRVELTVPSEKLRGNVALVSNFGSDDKSRAVDTRPNAKQEKSGSRFRFRRWMLAGEGFSVHPERCFGPILWSMYSLSDTRTDEGFVLKLSALTAPMGVQDSQSVALEVKRNGKWTPLGDAPLDKDAWVATFRIPQWSASKSTPFRLVYQSKQTDGTQLPHIWEGTIQANPQDRPLRMAALTCQNDYAFPYEPVAKNVAALKPDLVFFSGDQIYESHGGFGIIRKPAEQAIICYLRKFYQFGWAFRDVMRDAPTLCLPDDHDVLQGNLWGEGGTPMRNPERDPGASLLGGYVEPARVVNAVHRTNCAHHPDPYDPTPSQQGIGVYYGDLVYGDVSFAILADRQWKSDPERVKAVVGKDYGPGEKAKAFDQPGLVLLGERQESFLRHWSSDWRGHKLKCVLSQTLFSCLSTHQPTPQRYLRFDFDSNSWPQTPRNVAVKIMREAKALHICGDTHLGTLSQYGVVSQRDCNWAFCTPAIAAGWQRWWLPDDVDLPVANRPEHGLPNTGEYLDAFGNNTFVYAVGNPVVGSAANRYDRAHEKGSGFGVVTFDAEKLTYSIEAFRFKVEATDGKKTNQFDGWPVIIHQNENGGGVG